jgi:hypothetical protein
VALAVIRKEGRKVGSDGGGVVGALISEGTSLNFSMMGSVLPENLPPHSFDILTEQVKLYYVPN